MTGLSRTRRAFLRQLGGATCLAGGLACSWTAGSRESHRARPSLGFLRQADAASLLLAEELGYYGKQNLNPRLQRAVSPLDLRDRLTTGELLAAQLPASLPIALASASPSAAPTDLVTLLVLSQNGAAVTLARDLCSGVKFLDLEALRQVILHRAASSPVAFAVPVAAGCDDLMLRYLLASAGVPADRVQIHVLPPDRMIGELRDDRIIGFAAPDPWSALAAQQDVGFTFATAQDIWRTAPRSALVTTVKTLAARRSELKAVVRAVMETSVWLDVPANRARMITGDVLARHQNLDLDSGPIRSRLANVYDLGCGLGERDFEEDILFFHHGGRVNSPRRADALLYLALLARFGLIPAPARPAVLDRAIQPELYQEVAREMGVLIPDDMRPFVVTLDAARFDPNAPDEWLHLWDRP